MNSFFYISLFILWTLFWSFASVIIYRLKSWEKWIWTGRSHCNKCNHILSYLDLLPIFSYIFNYWKCRYCKDKISLIYPILELSTGVLYFLIWYLLIDFNLVLSLDILEITKLIFFLTIWLISIVYTYYDILFLEIHEKVLWVWIISSIIILSIQTIIPYFQVIPFLPYMIYDTNIWIYSIILSLLIISSLYLIMLRWLKELYDVIIVFGIIISLLLFQFFFDIELSQIPILSWILWALGFFIFFFLQILVSWWAWMWWWDLRIAILIGLILGVPLSFAWGMITYLIWSIIGLCLILYTRIRNKKWVTMDSQIPFWPFLSMWFFVAIFYQMEISNIIEIYFNRL